MDDTQNHNFPKYFKGTCLCIKHKSPPYSQSKNLPPLKIEFIIFNHVVYSDYSIIYAFLSFRLL